MRHLRTTASDAMHAEVGRLLWGIRDATDDLISIRQREHGQLIDGELEELVAIYKNLEWLLNDIRGSRMVA